MIGKISRGFLFCGLRYLATMNSEKKILYIIILNIFDIEFPKISIRYYSINIYELYNIKFFKEVRIFSFNNFLSLGYSYCNNDFCQYDNDTFFSSLIIFS